MRLTTENFFSMLKGEGITFEIHGEHIFSTNGYKDTIKQLYGLLDKQPDFEAGLIQSMNMKHTTSLKDFMTDTEGAGVKVELHELHNLTFTGGKAKSRERLAGILERNNRLKAAVILSLAAKNAKNQNFLDVIQECACNRWCDGYSDSLLMAVLCNITPTGETVERDTDGEIILKPKTDRDKEIASL